MPPNVGLVDGTDVGDVEGEVDEVDEVDDALGLPTLGTCVVGEEAGV